ncbi:hypothetical protein C8J57DRAFT_1584081 [Mycena rebaudengoi]|nr:hypothetical protein C8J57DRAFT_1584081 [Mycena rebaudengoi]
MQANTPLSTMKACPVASEERMQNIYASAIPSGGSTCFVKVPAATYGNLRELRIHENNFGIWNPFDALPTDTWVHIKVLRLSFCYLAGNATLASWLSLFPHLEHLEFRHSVMVPDIVMVSTAGQSREQHLKLLPVDERTLEFVAEWVYLHAVTVDGLVFNDAVTAHNLISLNTIPRNIGKNIRRITLGLLLFGPPEDPILVDYCIELRASSLTGYIPATEFSAIINRITSPFIEDILFEIQVEYVPGGATFNG